MKFYVNIERQIFLEKYIVRDANNAYDRYVEWEMRKEAARSLRIFHRNTATESGGNKFLDEFMIERFSITPILQSLG